MPLERLSLHRKTTKPHSPSEARRGGGEKEKAAFCWSFLQKNEAGEKKIPRHKNQNEINEVAEIGKLSWSSLEQRIVWMAWSNFNKLLPSKSHWSDYRLFRVLLRFFFVPVCVLIEATLASIYFTLNSSERCWTYERRKSKPHNFFMISLRLVFRERHLLLIYIHLFGETIGKLLSLKRL